jgi:hypothetical protein
VDNPSDYEQGIANRGKGAEEPGQDFVMDTVSEMERREIRDDLNTDDRLEGEQGEQRDGRNLEPDTVEGDIRAQQGRSGDT